MGTHTLAPLLGTKGRTAEKHSKKAGSRRTSTTEIMICEPFDMGKHLGRGASAKLLSPSTYHIARVENTIARGSLASSH